MSKRDHGIEFQWMGSGVTPEQRELIEQMVAALQHYAQGDDPGLALHALKMEGLRRPNHAALGGMTPPMEDK